MPLMVEQGCVIRNHEVEACVVNCDLSRLLLAMAMSLPLTGRDVGAAPFAHFIQLLAKPESRRDRDIDAMRKSTFRVSLPLIVASGHSLYGCIDSVFPQFSCILEATGQRWKFNPS